mmetsp:Transcript_73547/g.227143  ORF Transcript_73547/g.227143 Transcript_73547/m.227143 type:complete len:267 (+) Transcript_73547:81-881(+)
MHKCVAHSHLGDADMQQGRGDKESEANAWPDAAPTSIDDSRRCRRLLNARGDLARGQHDLLPAGGGHIPHTRQGLAHRRSSWSRQPRGDRSDEARGDVRGGALEGRGEERRAVQERVQRQVQPVDPAESSVLRLPADTGQRIRHVADRSDARICPTGHANQCRIYARRHVGIPKRRKSRLHHRGGHAELLAEGEEVPQVYPQGAVRPALEGGQPLLDAAGGGVHALQERLLLGGALLHQLVGEPFQGAERQLHRRAELACGLCDHR